MNKIAFVNFLKSNGFKGEEFNSNNAWGFGGAIGDKYEKGGIVVKVAKAYYRHLNPTSFITITIPERGRVFDQLQSPKNFDLAVRVLKAVKKSIKEQDTTTTTTSTTSTSDGSNGNTDTNTDTSNQQPQEPQDPRIAGLQKEKDKLLTDKQKLTADTTKYTKMKDLLDKNHLIPSAEKIRKIDKEIEDKNDKIEKLQPSLTENINIMKECATCGCGDNAVNFDKFMGMVKEHNLVEQTTKLNNVTKKVMSIVQTYRNGFNNALTQSWGHALQQLKSLKLSGSTVSFDGYLADSSGTIKNDTLLKGLMVEVIDLYLAQAPEWLAFGESTGIVLLVHGRDLNDNNKEKWLAVNGYKINVEPQNMEAPQTSEPPKTSAPTTPAQTPPPQSGITEGKLTKSEMVKLIKECIAEVIEEDFTEGQQVLLQKFSKTFTDFYYGLVQILNDELKSTDMQSSNFDKRTNKLDPDKIYFYSDAVIYLTERSGKIEIGKIENGKEVNEKVITTPQEAIDYMGQYVTISENLNEGTVSDLYNRIKDKIKNVKYISDIKKANSPDEIKSIFDKFLNSIKNNAVIKEDRMDDKMVRFIGDSTDGMVRFIGDLTDNIFYDLSVFSIKNPNALRFLKYATLVFMTLLILWSSIGGIDASDSEKMKSVSKNITTWSNFVKEKSEKIKSSIKSGDVNSADKISNQSAESIIKSWDIK